MGRFEGKYTRRQGMKRTYDYDLSVLKTANGFSWEAKILYAGQLKSSPSGLFLVPLEEAEATARSKVEQVIEAFTRTQE